MALELFSKVSVSGVGKGVVDSLRGAEESISQKQSFYEVYIVSIDTYS